MSDVVLVALITGGSTALVGIAGLLLNFWTQHQERSHTLERLKLEHEEKYRSDLYAKRLEVHQQAYSWLMKLTERVGWLQSSKLSSSDLKKQVRTETREARTWWDSNCLYLDDQSRSAVVRFIELTKTLAGDDPQVDEDKPIKAYVEALKLVQEGIGMKHLDVPAPSSQHDD